MGKLMAVGGVTMLFAVIYVAVVGVAGFGGWYRPGANADRAAEVLDEIYQSAPYLSRLDQDSPDLHDRLVANVTREVEIGLASEDILASALKLFEQWQADSMPDAPDRLLIAYHDLAIDRLRELKDSNPALCAVITLGRPFDDPSPYLSPQLRQREMYLNRLLLRAGPDEPVSRMTSAEVQAIANGIYAALRTAIGEDAALLYVDRETTPQEDAIICRLGIATMETIANQGPSRSPALIRGLFFAG